MKKFSFPPQIKQYLDKAEEYQSKGLYDKAIIQLRIAIQICPESAVAHNNLGAALANCGKYEEAEKEFQLAIALAQSDKYIHAPYWDAEQNLIKLNSVHVDITKLRVSVFTTLGSALAICLFSSLFGLKGEMMVAKIIASCGYLGAFVLGHRLAGQHNSYFTMGASIWALAAFLINIIFRKSIGGLTDAIIFSGINLFGFFSAYQAGALALR